MTNVNLTFDAHYEDHVMPKHQALMFRQNFKSNDDLYSATIELTIEDSVHSTLQIIKKIVNDLFPNMGARIETVCPEASFIRIDNHILVLVSHSVNDIWAVEKTKLRVKVYGVPETVRKFSVSLKEATIACKSPVVEWHYMVQGCRNSTSIFLEDRPVIKKEFYPWFKEDPNSYIDRFMKSKSGLLILRGEPGTGKTSFIRNLLWHCDAKSMITYEEELFKSDDLFVEFLTDECDVLIMEDADALLESRIQTGNTSMTKFLNVSDGIINFPKKKLIISANTVDNSKIDEALLRPGRCFDAPIFRRLTYAETQAACEAASIACPPEQKEYSLAEMFSYGNGGATSSPKSGRDKFGFAVREAA